MLKKLLILLVSVQGLASANCKAPASIKVPAGYQVLGLAHAKGEQIYQCDVNQGQYTWESKAPDALLFDDQGKMVGKHYAGPTWEANDGGRIIGKVVNKLDVTPATSIPWLLVEVVSHQGKGVLAEARFINRINTQGGLPPISGCDSNHLGNEKGVAYTADYVFFSKAVSH